MKRPVPVHYLRPNHGEWTPPCVITLDTETRDMGEHREIQVMRLWCGTRIDRPDGITDWSSRDDRQGTTAVELADTVEGWFKGRNTIWLYCHNLSFDLSVTRLPLELIARGWETTDFALDGRAPWMRLTKGRKHLTLSDSWSWLSASIEQIGGMVGLEKPPLPDDDDSQEAWYYRCRSDTEILTRAMHTLMDWWQTTGRGRWSITGAASGWNAFRHTPAVEKITIDPNPEQVAWDRKAVYGGKRWVGHVGTLNVGRYAEIDFERAYTTVAAQLPLPIRRRNSFTSIPCDDPRVDSERWGIIAEVELETDVPRWPVRHGGRVWYPVGRFTTTLASPDIVAARSAGCLRSIGRGYTYQLGQAMAPWARWCLDLQAQPADQVPGVVKIAAKGWGRSVIGKWAQRSYDRIKLGVAPTLGWGYEDTWMHNEQSKGSVVDLGGQRWISFASGDGDNAFPAILAFVESHVRVRLNRAMEIVGPTATVQCDTDGMIIAERALNRQMRKVQLPEAEGERDEDTLARALSVVSYHTAPLVLRVKSIYHRVTTIGPQHMILNGHRRFSGVPASAEEWSDGALHAKVWPKMAWQMKHGDQRGYVREWAKYVISGTYAPGWVLQSGTVVPVEMTRGGDGENVVLPWELSRYPEGGAQRAECQSRDVLRVVKSGSSSLVVQGIQEVHSG